MPASAPAHAPGSTSKRTSVQKAALVVGAVFLLGVVPGSITMHYDQLTFAGHHSDAALLGIFSVSAMIALGAALGRTRDDTGRPVGAKEGAHANTPDAQPR